MRIILSSIFLVFTLSGWAQTMIAGKINDASTGEGMEYATVSVLKTDSTLITGSVTDTSGVYRIADIPPGEYILKLDFIGYTAQYKNIKVDKGQPFQKVDLVTLEPAEGMMDEVQITDQKMEMITRIDKKIFNVEKQIVASGGTGLDLLRTIPSIDVDAEDVISLRGDENVRIMFDSRPSAMPAAQLLKQMPASMIEKVEVITNPSAKYDPEGMSGIINIILKKDKNNKGFNGMAGASFGYGKYPKANGSLNLNYTTGKIKLYGGYNYTYSKFWFGGYNNRYFSDYTLKSEDEGYWYGSNHFARAGLDYFINDNHTVYLSGRMSSRDGGQNQEYFYTNSIDTLTDNFYRKTEGTSLNYDWEINGGWQAKFNKPDHTLDLDVTYSYAPAYDDKVIAQHEYWNDEVQDYESGQHTINDNLRRQLYTRLDYVYPITDSITLEAGIHTTINTRDDDFFSESRVSPGSGFMVDDSLNNRFIYNQQVYAAYTTFGHQVGKFGYKLGLRAEQTMTNSRLVTTDEDFTNNYFQLFPSAHFSYKPNMKNEIQLSYSRRINRPNIRVLNPFPDYSDPYTLQKGNPFLLPEFIHVAELGYILYTDKWTVNTTAYYRYLTNMTRRVLIQTDTVSVVSFENIDNGHLTGLELIVNYNPFKWWRIGLNGNLYYTIMGQQQFANEDNYNFNTLGWQASLNNSFNFKWGMSIQLNTRYSAGQNVLQGYMEPRWNMDLGIQQKILKNRGTISLRFSDMFFTQQFTFSSVNIDTYSFDTQRRWESRQIWLSFNYFFGKMVRGKQKRRLKDKDAGDDMDIPDMQ